MQVNAQNNSIKFESGEVDLKWIHQGQMKYAALLIPVQFDNDDNLYYMQFDMGANKTVFYKNAPVKNSFKIGKSIARVESIIVKDIPYSEKSKIVGTIGMDLIESTSMVLDFKKNIISFNQDISEKTASKFYYIQEKVLLPATIGEEQKMLLYDSGSSAFDLITDKENWSNIRDQSTTPQIFETNSWGKKVTVHISKAIIPVKIDNEPLNINQVAYVEGISDENVAHMRQTGMQGMIGNTIFLDKVVYFDFNNKTFGVDTE